MGEKGKRLNDIIQGIKALALAGDMDTLVYGMTMDSRKVKPGDIYACIPGFTVDGHDFAEKAVASGAAALIVERFLPLEVPQIKVRNVRQVLGILASELYSHPTSKIEVVGVTGTNGKTTVTHLIEQIGKFHGKKVGLIGTLGARIAGKEIPGERTTPEAVEMQKLFAQMREEEVSLAVMEVSSHALDLGRVRGIEFDAAIFTNLTQDHLDYHKTMEDYLKAKAKLFSSLKGEKQPKLAVINGDDPAAADLAQASTATVIRYGIHAQELDYRAEELDLTALGIRFAISFNGKRQAVTYATPGVFSVYNVLAAFAWAVERGYAPGDVAQALTEVAGVAGRFESVRLNQPFQVIVDYAHTPDGLENVLKTARDFTKGRLITVFGCGGDRDRGKRPLMGKVASEWSDFVLVTSDNPRTEEPDRIIEEILAGVKDVEHIALRDRREAIWNACRLAKREDTVLIAGKGHETYQIVGKEVFPFDDREVSREALRGLGYAQLDE